MADIDETTGKFVWDLIEHLNRNFDYSADIDPDASTSKRKPVIAVDVYGEDDIENSFNITVEKVI